MTQVTAWRVAGVFNCATQLIRKTCDSYGCNQLTQTPAMAHGQVSRAFCYYMLQNTPIICDFDAVCRRAQCNCIKTDFTGALGI